MTNSKRIKMSVFSMFMAAALLASIVTVTGMVDNAAFAKHNLAHQLLDQASGTGQASSCSSENGSSTGSCNNVALSFNGQLGNNALGQE